MNRAYRTLSLALLIAAATAQQAKPRFTLPSGEHGVTALIELQSQLVLAPIAYAAANLALLPNRTITIDSELLLPAHKLADVVSRLLADHGVLIVEVKGHRRAVASRDVGCIDDVATERAIEDVRARPGRMEYVATSIDLDSCDPQLVTTMLHSFGAAHGSDPLRLQHEVVDGKLQLRGTTDHVLLADRQLALVRGQLTTSGEFRFASDKPLVWPGGTMTVAELAANTGQTLSTTVLGSRSSDTAVELGQPEQLSPREWLARAARTFAEADLVLTTADCEHRLLQLHDSLPSAMLQAQVLAPEQIQGHSMPVLTSVTLHGINAMAALRTIARGRKVSAYMLADDRLMIAGVSDEVAAAVDELRKMQKAHSESL